MTLRDQVSEIMRIRDSAVKRLAKVGKKLFQIKKILNKLEGKGRTKRKIKRTR